MCFLARFLAFVRRSIEFVIPAVGSSSSTLEYCVTASFASSALILVSDTSFASFRALSCPVLSLPILSYPHAESASEVRMAAGGGLRMSCAVARWCST